MPGHEIAALHALGLSWVTLDHEICLLKIRRGGSIDGTAAALPRLRRLSTGFAVLGADRLGPILTLRAASLS